MAFMGALWQNVGGLDPDSSAILLRAALDTTEKAVGRSCALYADIAIKLAELLGHLGNFEESEKLFRQAIGTRIELLGVDHVDVAKAKIDFAYMHSSRGDYVEAESFYLDAIGSLDRSSKPDRQLVLFGRYLLAQLYMQTSRNSAALELLESGLPQARVAGDKYLESLYLNDLSGVSLNSGQYQAAQEYAEESLNLSRDLWGEVHPDVAVSLINLANLLNQLGQYSRAEKYARQGLDIWDKVLGSDQGEEWIESMNILARILEHQSRLSEAENIFNQTLRAVEARLGAAHPLATESLDGLAEVYSDQRDFAKASAILRRLIQLDSLIYGPQHVFVAKDINHLSSISFEQGDYDRADSLESIALGMITADSYSKRHLFAQVMMNLAVIRTANGRLTEADSLFQQSLAELTEIMGAEHPRVAHGLSAYSSLKLKLGDLDEARRLSVAAFEAAYKHLQNNIDILREKDALAFAERLRGYADLCLSIILTSEGLSRSWNAAAITLSVKGVVSECVAARIDAQRGPQVVSTNQTMRRLQALRSELSERLTAGPGRDETSYRAGIDSLAKLADSLDSWLALHNANYLPRRGKTSIEPTLIAGRLPKGKVLVEYLLWQSCESTWSRSLPRYLALVLHPGNSLAVYDLGDANAIDTLVSQYRDHMASVSARGHLPSRSQLERYRSIGRELYQLLLKPLRAEIGRSDQLLISPDGGLNLIPFGTLVDDSNRFVIESLDLTYVSSGRDLLGDHTGGTLSEGLLAVGDPDFNVAVADRSDQSYLPIARAARPSNLMYNQRSACSELDKLAVDRLPATRSEVLGVVNSWNALQQNALVFLDSLATEGNFKLHCSGMKAIHLATHGFSLNAECRDDKLYLGWDGASDIFGENPLLLSGLVLAGANRHTKNVDSLDFEDGILTSMEIAGLDLRGTELVVLSACESGLGKVENGEGVYGLRRAFLLAGARTVISALWKIDDQATAEMMSQLFAGQGQSVSERIRTAQLAQIQKLRAQGLPDHPFSWGAFIATGDWR